MRLIHPTCSFSPNEGQGIAEEGFVPFEKKRRFPSGSAPDVRTDGQNLNICPCCGIVAHTFRRQERS